MLLFDVMGTIVHDPFAVELPAFFGMPFEDLLEQKHPTSWVEFETAAIDEATFLRHFFASSSEDAGPMTTRLFWDR